MVPNRPAHHYSLRNHFNLHFAYLLKLYAAAVISLQFTKTKFKCIKICFMIPIQFLFGNSVR